MEIVEFKSWNEIPSKYRKDCRRLTIRNGDMLRSIHLAECIRLAIRDDKVIGWSLVDKVRTNVYIKKIYRRQGIGTKLVKDFKGYIVGWNKTAIAFAKSVDLDAG